MTNLLLLIMSCIILAACSWLYFNHKKTQRQINKWQRHFKVNGHERVFQQLYQPINGFLLSKAARTNQDAIEYTYGEIEFKPFIALLSLLKLDSKTVFYDLGSGTGKAVLACAMVYPVQRSVGIELFSSLHTCACTQQSALANQSGYTQRAAAIEFVHGDFLEVDLDDATVIFINASALFGLSWNSLCQRLTELPQLQTVITTSKPLNNECFIITGRTSVEMSWGIVSAFIHFKNK